MHCEEFRRAIVAEPRSVRAGVTEHVEACETCAAYQRRLRVLDRAIFAALHTDISARAPQPLPSLRRPAWSVAAALLLSVALASSIWLASTRSGFAAEVVVHAQHEPTSLVHTLDVVPDAELSALLERGGLHLLPGIIRVSYARSCRFRGRFAPHLVVQADPGPVAVLVLPHERTPAGVERLHEPGFDGIIVPAPRGVLVVLGHGAAAEAVAQATLRAIDYST